MSETQGRYELDNCLTDEIVICGQGIHRRASNAFEIATLAALDGGLTLRELRQITDKLYRRWALDAHANECAPCADSLGRTDDAADNRHD